MGSIALFIGVTAFKVHQSHERNELVIHDSSEVLISRLAGRKAMVWGMQNDYHGGQVSDYVQAKGAEIISWKEPAVSGAVELGNGLLVHGQFQVDTFALGLPDRLILARNLKWSTRKLLLNWAHTNQVKVHDIRSDGAFVQ